jgi:quercetin dioxygenase-like cupin family protein
MRRGSLKVIPPGGGEVVGDAPDRRVEILAEHDALHATWSRFGPGREGADLHVHRHHADLFYVLAGELTVRLGPEGESVRAPAGTFVRVPPLVIHGFRNAGDRELRYLNFHAPGVGFADYLRAMRDGRKLAFDQHPPPEDGGRPASEAVVGGDAVSLFVPGVQATQLVDVEEITVTELEAERATLPWEVLDGFDAFYVLEGELTLTVGDRVVRVESGSWAQLPAGVTAEVTLAGEPGRVLRVRAPG